MSVSLIALSCVIIWTGIILDHRRGWSAVSDALMLCGCGLSAAIWLQAGNFLLGGLMAAAVAVMLIAGVTSRWLDRKASE